MNADKPLKGRPKEILVERAKTTARIPKPLQKVVQKRCIDLDVDQTDAINEGLELWLIYHNSDKALRLQLDHQLKKLRIKFGDAHEETGKEGHRATG